MEKNDSLKKLFSCFVPGTEKLKSQFPNLIPENQKILVEQSPDFISLTSERLKKLFQNYKSSLNVFRKHSSFW